MPAKYSIHFGLAIVVCAVLAAGTVAAQQVVVSQNGPIELAISNDQYTCPRANQPDMPVHVYRALNNELRIFATNASNYPFISPSFALNDLRKMHQICTPMLPVYSPSARPNPQTFVQRQWITATYTLDGKIVHGFVHNEFHGEDYSLLNPPCTESGVKCLYSSLTKAISVNSGSTFVHALTPPEYFIAGPLHRFTRYQPNGAVTTRVGTAGPSNVVRNPKDGFYYMFMRHFEDYGPQEYGECVVRSRDLREWFFWDGSGFTKQFEDPYTTKKTPAERVCKTLDNHFGRIRSVVYSFVYHVFITVVPSGNGIGYATSSDLINWSPLVMISRLKGVQTAPSIIDHSTRARNFDVTGDSPYLYWTDDLTHQVYRVKLRISAN